MKTVSGTIYWPLYVFEVIRSEIISPSFPEQDQSIGVVCPYLSTADPDAVHCKLQGGNLQCQSTNNSCHYKDYHVFFLLLKTPPTSLRAIEEEMAINGDSLYSEIYGSEQLEKPNVVRDLLNYFPQPFDCLGVKKHLTDMDEQTFFQESKEGPQLLDRRYTCDETIYVRSEHTLFKQEDESISDRAFHQLIRINEVKKLLPNEKYDPEKDRLLPVRLSFFADRRVDAVLSLIINAQTWSPNSKYTRATKRLISQALGSINRYVYRDRLEFVESWCHRLAERVRDEYHNHIAPAGDAMDLALKFAKKATTIMCQVLSASGNNSPVEIEFSESEWVLSDKVKKLGSDRKKYLNDFLKKAKIHTDAALKMDSKLKGRLAAATELELLNISQHDDPLKAIILLRGEPGGGKGVAAEDFHRKCMKRIAESKEIKRDYLCKIEEALQTIFESPAAYMQEKTDPKCDLFIRQVAGTGWWRWDLADKDKEELKKTQVGQASLNAYDNKKASFKAQKTWDKLIECYINLVKAKLEMEYLRGTSADFSFNFFQVNCGILGGRDSELAESVKRLFGVCGDSNTALPGLFQICSYVGGTLFLDEIADAPIRIQDNLLRPLEEGKVSRPGWETFDEVVKNVRIIGATFKDLFYLARQYQETLPTGNPKGFRPDLLTRLTRNAPVSIVPIWHYFIPKSSFESGDYPYQFAYVLSEAFKVDMPFWEDVYWCVSKRLDERERMSADIMPDEIDRRRHFASKISMRLFKHVGHLTSKESKKGVSGKITKYHEEAKNYALNQYLPRMLDYLFSG